MTGRMGRAPVLKAALAVAALVTLLGVSADTVVVSPTDLDGWTMSHSHCNGGISTGSQVFVAGPLVPPAGTGSLQFMTGPDGDSFETFRTTALNGTRLSDITALSYGAFTTSATGQVVYVNLLVSSTGSGVVDNQLFFEPVYQTDVFNASLPDQGPIVPGTWQTWDALAGGWWDLDGFAGPGTGVRSLADYAAAFPDAIVANTGSGLGGLRLAAGCGHPAWADFIGHADNVTLAATGMASTTYDFELVAPPTTTTPTTSASMTSSGTTTGNGTGTSTTTPQIPFFPTSAALVVALGGALVAGFVILRKRR